MLSGRGLCDELITRPEESYQLCCVVMCDLETSTMCAPYKYDISRLRVKGNWAVYKCCLYCRFCGKLMSDFFFEQSVDFSCCGQGNCW